MPASQEPSVARESLAAIERARAAGRAAFGDEFAPPLASIAPGRIELLGNHVDYNGGPVLAAAIDQVVVVVVDEGGGAGQLQAVAADISPAPMMIALDVAVEWRSAAGEPDSEAYLRGSVAALMARGNDVRDRCRLAIAGNVALGFGMSSSAALCVALVNALARSPLPPRELVLAAQDAEHRAGTPCGTMDQSASVAGNVILYDGADDSYTVLQPELGSHIFAVADSGVTRSLGSSSYATRVEESKRALELLRQHLDPKLSLLGHLDAAQWHEIERHGEAWLPAPLFARVRHIVTECDRVRAGIAAVEQGDWREFGRLMTASGQSSANDYDISHPRVETLVAEVNAVEGVLGARMMGGGEGGPALVLLHREVLPELERSLRQGYYRRVHMADRDRLVYACRFGPGARVIDLPR